ncbi:MAG: hypothetical protein DI535_25050 [Citrobacter freundii]|nr:MAG: hypothetical protein DI535_25050 [Citrobacter freundii]
MVTMVDFGLKSIIAKLPVFLENDFRVLVEFRIIRNPPMLEGFLLSFSYRFKILGPIIGLDPADK